MTKLQIPCAYQGGKQRIAADIIDIIFNNSQIDEYTKFYDLCCGSGAISIELISRGLNPQNIVMVDQSPWGLFWQMIGDGTFNIDTFRSYIDEIPKDITKIKQYAQNMTKQPAIDDIVYRFLILQSCAFGSSATWIENGKWIKAGGLRDYWLPTETSNRKSPVNPMMPMPETLFKRVQEISIGMKRVMGYYGDVSEIKIEDRSIVYIDPPYDGTTGYGYNFDYIDYINKIKKDNIVYLSEGKKIFDHAVMINGSRSKGGISGERKTKNEEWLNIIGGD